MAENIEIQVQDKVAPSISTKLRGIATDAREADSAVKLLQNSLKGLSASSGLQKLQTELAKTAVQNQRLATETQKTQVAMANVEAALNRAVAAEARANAALSQLSATQTKAALEAQKLATEQQKTAQAYLQTETALNRAVTAETNAATAAQRLTTEQQRTATAAAQAAAAQTKATTATTQGQTATQNLAAATTRASTAQTQGATAAARLATEQQRTATQTANAAAANDRAALAALRLAQAQQRAGQASQTAGQQIAGYVKAAAGIAGVTLSASAILSAADAYVTLQNKLQNVTTSQAQVNKLTGELFELANKTRSGVEETATAFTRFDRSLKAMGKSQEDSLRLTETINKALIVSGATSTEASSALLQLSQAFNAGKLQGDEFRAVSENMPIVLDAVAKATNQPINQIKKFASEGKITSEVLYKAFALIQKQVDDTFAKTTPTIGQSLNVLKNSATQFFGELNKSTGFTAGLSKMILVLANNMNVLAAGIAVVGAAFLAYFGSSLIGTLTTATRAVMAFTAAIAANPIGLLLVGITAAITAIVLFGDKIKVTSDGLVSLKDVALSVWSFIKDGIGAVATFIQSAWGTAIDWINEKTNGWGEQFRNIGETILKLGKTYVNAQISFWVGAFGAIKAIWNNFPALMQGFFAGVVNFAASAVETIVNSWQIGLRLVAKAAESVAPDVAKSLNGALDSITLKLPRMDTSAGVDAAKDVAKAFTDAFNKDYVGDAATAVMGRAREIAASRRAAEAANANTQLRGAGVSQLGKDTDEKAAKAAERRALALQKINAQLDNELSRMFTLQPQREAQAKMDQIEESLIQRKIKLNDSERASIMAKIQAVQDATIVQQKYDAIYQEAVGPQRDYNASLTAAQKLLQQGAVTQEQYTRAVTKATEEYKNNQDPMRQYNKDLQQQFDLLNMLPKQREVEQQIMQVQNDLLTKGITLNAQELAQLRERLTLLQQLNAVSQQEASLLDGSVNKRQGFIDQLTAINKLLADQKSGFTKSDALTAIGGTDVGQYLTGSPEMVNAQVSQYQNLYAQIDQLRQADLISEQTASAAKMQIWNAQQNAQLTTANTFFGNLAQMQSSSNKRLAAVGKAAAITQAMINTYQSATGAYASLASIPYVGPALGAAAAAAAIAAGLANVQQIRSQNTSGYMTGGYTGNGPVGQIAGNVHGKEFVMNASTTSRLGVDNLQALQSGAASIQGGPSSGQGGGNVGNGGEGQSTNVQVPIKLVNVIDPSEALNALNTSEGERLILNVIERNPNTVRKMVS